MLALVWLFIMATRAKKKITVNLKFNRKRGGWEAFIDDKLCGYHRYERRALIFGVQNYAKERDTDPRAFDPEPHIQWNRQLKKIYEIFKAERAGYEAAKEAFAAAELEIEERKKSYRTTLAQFAAALMDYGFSASGAAKMAGDASVNTIHRYIKQVGGEQKAAEDMWKRAKVKFSGMLQLKEGEDKTSSSPTNELENVWSLYDDKE